MAHPQQKTLSLKEKLNVEWKRAKGSLGIQIVYIAIGILALFTMYGFKWLMDMAFSPYVKKGAEDLGQSSDHHSGIAFLVLLSILIGILYRDYLGSNRDWKKTIEQPLTMTLLAILILNGIFAYAFTDEWRTYYWNETAFFFVSIACILFAVHFWMLKTTGSKSVALLILLSGALVGIYTYKKVADEKWDKWSKDKKVPSIDLMFWQKKVETINIPVAAGEKVSRPYPVRPKGKAVLSSKGPSKNCTIEFSGGEKFFVDEVFTLTYVPKSFELWCRQADVVTLTITMY